MKTMARRALIDHRPWLFAGLLAGIAYYFVRGLDIGELWLILLKGAGVGCLALYVLVRARQIDGTILALALALSAAGDMALELWFEIGGALFASSHVVATVLYLRNRDDRAGTNAKLMGALLLVAAPAGALLLSGDPLIAVYATFLGAMAATAWNSRFPRPAVGLGAVLFVLSDWLIFSRMGTVDLGPLPDWLVWPLYFAGQVMIATGVVRTLRADHKS